MVLSQDFPPFPSMKPRQSLRMSETLLKRMNVVNGINADQESNINVKTELGKPLSQLALSWWYLLHLLIVTLLISLSDYISPTILLILRTGLREQAQYRCNSFNGHN